MDKKKYFLIVLMFFIFSKIFCQWEYKSVNNPFDGNMKLAYVVGTGYERPYTEPVFTVRVREKDINSYNFAFPDIYISNAGYSGCDNKVALITFDNDQSIIYRFPINPDVEKSAWFIDYNGSKTFGWELLDKMKTKNKMYVRLSSDCSQNDFEFTLSGSTNAINYVAANYIKLAKQKVAERDQKEKVRNEKINLLMAGEEVLAKTIYKASLFSSNFEITDKILQIDEIINVRYCQRDNNYVLLKKCDSYSISESDIYYVKLYNLSFDLEK